MEVICRERQLRKPKLLCVIWLNKLNFGKIIKQGLALWPESGTTLLLAVLIVLQLKVTGAQTMPVKVKSYIRLCILNVTGKA